MKIFQKILLILLIITAIIYFSFLYVIPGIVNSAKFAQAAQKEILKRTSLETSLDGLNYHTNPDLSSDFYIKSLAISKNNKTYLSVKELRVEFNPLSLRPQNVSADYIFFDKTKFTPQNKEKKSEFNLIHIPRINIKKAYVILQKDKKNFSNITLSNISVAPQGEKQIITFNTFINSNFIQKGITAGADGYLYIKDNELFANDFHIITGKTDLAINGKLFSNNRDYDFKVTGEKVSVNELERAFLFDMKQKKSEKNFIENFYDFSGLADINVRITNAGVFGNTLIHGLSAKTIKFSIPIYFPAAEFKFDKDKITAAAHGTLGNEKIFTDFSTTDLYSQNRLVKGSVKSTLTPKFTNKYTPDYDIVGKLGVYLTYHVQHHEVTVEYLASIPKGSNLYYRNANLGLTTTDRRVFAKTFKKGNNLYLKNYDYSFVDDSKTENIILGDGLFVKKNGKYKLDYITCRTNGDAPVSVTGSFGQYIDGGTFNGNLRYAAEKNLLTGRFNLKDSKYKDFYVKHASINADNTNFIISAEGTYQKSKFTCDINMKNEFEDTITIHDMNLYLAKYIIRSGKKHKKPGMNIPENAKDITWIVEKGNIKLDKLRYKRVVLENLDLTGNLQNKIVNFSMPAIGFADGKLSAKGIYNINNHSSDIYFTAEKIDSNRAADMIFDLKDQVEGYANADMHLVTCNKLQNIAAHTHFAIENGALTKIGSTEFMIKKNKKIKRNLRFKLTDIINIDIEKMQALKSNMHGSFDVCDNTIKNLEIFSEHKFLSLFTEGDYDIKKQDASIRVWGKYNRNAQKGIRILFVPLSLITKIIFKPEMTKDLYADKLNKVPHIQATEKETEAFNVRMNGNLNDNSSMKVELKSIK